MDPDETPSINGWKPPLVYNIVSDTKRIATQDDIDRMERALSVFATFYRTVRDAVAVVDQYRASDSAR